MIEPLELIKNEFLDLKKELGEVTYQLINLYDRWVVEHQHVARREAEMMRAIELFTKQIAQLSDIKQQVIEEIGTSSTKAAVLVAEAVGKETQKTFAGAIQSLVLRFENAITQAEQVVPEYEKVKGENMLKVTIIAVLVSLLLGFAFGVFWVSKNTISIAELRQKK